MKCGSRLQGQGQPALRHARWPRHVPDVAGPLPRGPDPETIQKAVDAIKEQKDKDRSAGSPATTTPTTLAAGNIVVAQAYSGDVVQLQKDNPDLKFVIPETGSSTFVDTMVIPYHPEPEGRRGGSTTSTTGPTTPSSSPPPRHVPVLSDMTDALNKVDPELARTR